MTDRADQGLYGKFRVSRTDGRDAVGERHHGCTYFVLDLQHDQHMPAALRAYADSCEADYPALARDLRTVADDFGQHGDFVGITAQKPALDLERQVHSENASLRERLAQQVLRASLSPPEAPTLEQRRIAAYRQARIFEPSMDGYGAAMAVYHAAFPGADIDGAAQLHIAHVTAPRFATTQELARKRHDEGDDNTDHGTAWYPFKECPDPICKAVGHPPEARLIARAKAWLADRRGTSTEFGIAYNEGANEAFRLIQELLAALVEPPPTSGDGH